MRLFWCTRYLCTKTGIVWEYANEILLKDMTALLHILWTKQWFLQMERGKKSFFFFTNSLHHIIVSNANCLTNTESIIQWRRITFVRSMNMTSPLSMWRVLTTSSYRETSSAGEAFGVKYGESRLHRCLLSKMVFSMCLHSDWMSRMKTYSQRHTLYSLYYIK